MHQPKILLRFFLTGVLSALLVPVFWSVTTFNTPGNLVAYELLSIKPESPGHLGEALRTSCIGGFFIIVRRDLGRWWAVAPFPSSRRHSFSMRVARLACGILPSTLGRHLNLIMGSFRNRAIAPWLGHAEFFRLFCINIRFIQPDRQVAKMIAQAIYTPQASVMG